MYICLFLVSLFILLMYEWWEKKQTHTQRKNNNHCTSVNCSLCNLLKHESMFCHIGKNKNPNDFQSTRLGKIAMGKC